MTLSPFRGSLTIRYQLLEHLQDSMGGAGVPVQDCIRFHALHCSEVGTPVWRLLRSLDKEGDGLDWGFLVVGV
jgi:hypothetical protein